ncbi:hypothetical protein RF657_19310 [Yersinia rochesterensis]|uniref:hypothetical protein n=1 Tax=Yersinia rochesterensis TaxID=1604335 RepID=UPI00285333F9|nr:hypothetical protein [Yersinia rochesterensis]MDR5020514.1 hypothetical protein [Yersinia rochesterensis]
MAKSVTEIGIHPEYTYRVNNHIDSDASKDHYTSHGSGNGGGNDMLVRVAKLESDVEHIKKAIDDVKLDVREIKRDARTDFRIIFGSLITVALGLAGIMAKGFHWL